MTASAGIRIIGKIQRYDCASIRAVDAHLTRMRRRWRTLVDSDPVFAARMAPNYWHDIDLLLDRRVELATNDAPTP